MTLKMYYALKSRKFVGKRKIIYNKQKRWADRIADKDIRNKLKFESVLEVVQKKLDATFCEINLLFQASKHINQTTVQNELKSTVPKHIVNK